MISKPISDPPGCTTDILALQDTLEILGGKWTLLIIHYLMSREDELNTFKKIENDIPNLSAKVLTQELKLLELNQLIKREALHTKPVSVHYQITVYGKSLKPLIEQLVAWGTTHRKILFDKK